MKRLLASHRRRRRAARLAGALVIAGGLTLLGVYFSKSQGPLGVHARRGRACAAEPEGRSVHGPRAPAGPGGRGQVRVERGPEKERRRFLGALDPEAPPGAVPLRVGVGVDPRRPVSGGSDRRGALAAGVLLRADHRDEGGVLPEAGRRRESTGLRHRAAKHRHLREAEVARVLLGAVGWSAGRRRRAGPHAGLGRTGQGSIRPIWLIVSVGAIVGSMLTLLLGLALRGWIRSRRANRADRKSTR